MFPRENVIVCSRHRSRRLFGIGILGLLYFIFAVPEVFGDRSFCDAMPGNLDMQSL